MNARALAELRHDGPISARQMADAQAEFTSSAAPIERAPEAPGPIFQAPATYAYAGTTIPAKLARQMFVAPDFRPIPLPLTLRPGPIPAALALAAHVEAINAGSMSLETEDAISRLEVETNAYTVAGVAELIDDVADQMMEENPSGVDQPTWDDPGGGIHGWLQDAIDAQERQVAIDWMATARRLLAELPGDAALREPWPAVGAVVAEVVP